jgi:hypothetical protein
MLASGNLAPFDLVVTASKFESTQMARREAEASLTLDVIDRATGRGLYHDTMDGDLVDRLLDNPSFVAMVRRQQG